MHRRLIFTALLALLPSAGHATTLDEFMIEKGLAARSEEANAASLSPARVYWNNATRFEFPESGFSAAVSTLTQTRYTYTDRDREDPRRNHSSFDVVRARIALSGNAHDGEFSYIVEPELVAQGEDGSSSPELLDAYLAWHPTASTDLQLGQAKLPIDRQFNTHESKLQFPDRSLTSDYFNLDRQPGLSTSSEFLDGRFLSTLGLYNGFGAGEGRNRPGSDAKHTSVLALRWNALGHIDPFAEGDVEWTESAAFSLGSSYAYSDGRGNLSSNPDVDIDAHEISLDLNYKVRGFSAHAEIFYEKVEASLADSREAEPFGFYLQAGWFMEPRLFEIALRYSHLDCDSGRAPKACPGQDKARSAGVSFNYHLWAHNLKTQLAYEFRADESQDQSVVGDLKTNRWLIQLSGYL